MGRQEEGLVKQAFITGAKWMQHKDNWIDFKDQQPELYQSVNFVVDSSNERYNGKVYGGTYQGLKHGYYECSCPGIGFSATHWQPLPSPPKQNI